MHTRFPVSNKRTHTYARKTVENSNSREARSPRRVIGRISNVQGARGGSRALCMQHLMYKLYLGAFSDTGRGMNRWRFRLTQADRRSPCDSPGSRRRSTHRTAISADREPRTAHSPCGFLSSCRR